MIDINLLRKQLPEVVARLKTRNFEFPEKEFLALENERKEIQSKTEELQAVRNSLSRQIGQAKKSGESAEDLMKEAAALPEKLADLEKQLGEIRNKLNNLLQRVPNLPNPECPIGRDDRANVEQWRWGTPRQFDFPGKDHVDVAGPLGMDFDTAARLSGSRFCFMKGEIAHLHRALAQFMLDLHTRKHGYTECYTPYIVNASTMYGTGQLPKFAEDLYSARIGGYEEEGEHELQYLIPTAEVPLTNTVSGKMLKESDLPIKITAQTPCFRSEAGSYGRDTRGMIRQHQFEKVEMVRTVPETDSYAHLKEMVKNAEEVLQLLELPYRVIMLSTGDMGFSAAQTFDIEVWVPAQNTYREISSCSNCEDFQARRMGTRYKGKDGKTHYVHTLNGSGVAVGRCLVAVIENYQNADGSATIPTVLRPYMGGLEKIEPPAKKA